MKHTKATKLMLLLLLVMTTFISCVAGDVTSGSGVASGGVFTPINGAVLGVKDAVFDMLQSLLGIDNPSKPAPGCEHIWLPATCTNAQTCTICAKTEGEALGHSIQTDAAKSPTCTTDGRTEEAYCTVCGEVTSASEPIAALGHKYGEETVIKAPTCLENGEKELNCTVCFESHREDIPATGHSFESVTVQPDCTEDGYTLHTCLNCGYVYADSIVEHTGHSYESAVTKEPTCTAEGVMTYTCKCGDTYSEPISKKAHEYTQSVTEPTCTAPGCTTYTCACGYSYTDDHINATGHTKVDATCVSDGKCTVCGAKLEEALGHKAVIDLAKAPTCTKEGLTEGAHCERCGEILTKQDVIDALGHTVVTDKAVEPTCTESGLTEGKHCSICDEVFTAQTVIGKLGHDYSSLLTLAPTCTTDGTRAYTCQREECAHTYTETVPQTGHSFDPKGTVVAPNCERAGYTEHSCQNEGCGYYYRDAHTDALTHSYTASVTAPTCTEMGYTTYACEQCGDSYTDDYTPAKHDYTDTTVAPTCTEQGYTEHICKVCGDRKRDTYTAALGHTEVIDAAVEPTCTQSGLTEGKHCSVCGEILAAQTVINALGHEFDDDEDADCNICGKIREMPFSVGLAYTDNGDGTLTVAGIGTCTDTDIIIPSVLNGKTVTSIEKNAFANNKSILSVDIPGTVKTIGDTAFCECTNLKQMKLSEGIESIGMGSFTNCESLYSVVIPDSVTTLGDYAFSSAFGLVSVTLGKGLTTVGEKAFNGCFKIIEVYNRSSMSITGLGGVTVTALNKTETFIIATKNVYGPENEASKLVTDENGFIFYCDDANTYLMAYTGNANYLTLPEYAPNGQSYSVFKTAFVNNQSQLISVVIPSTVSEIGILTFLNCNKLESLTLPFAGKSASKGTFRSLFHVDVNDLADEVVGGTLGGFAGSYASSVLDIDIGSLPPSTLKTVVITGGTAIVKECFKGCSCIESITLPGSLTSIGANTFNGCLGLHTMYFDGTQAAWNNVTKGSSWSSGLSSTIIICTDGEACIAHAEKIDPAVAATCISTGLTQGSHCSACGIVLKAQQTTPTVSHTYSNSSDATCNVCGAVRELLSLDGVLFAPNLDGTYTVSGVDASIGAELVIPSTFNGMPVTSISAGAFANNPTILSVVIPTSVTSIGFGAFSGCSNIEKMTLPFTGAELDGTENTHLGYIFGASTYSDNGIYVPTSLKSVEIEGCATIPAYAMNGCTSITTVIVGESVTTIEKYSIDITSLSSLQFTDTDSSWTISGYTSLLSIPGNGSNTLSLYKKYGYKATIIKK